MATTSSRKESRLSSKGPPVVAVFAIVFFLLGIYLIFSGTDNLQVLSGTILFAISLYLTLSVIPLLSRSSTEKALLDISLLDPSSRENDLHVSWPKDKPRLRARFGMWTTKETIDALVDFILAMLPSDYRTYFAILEEYNAKYESHSELKRLLKASGEPFTEKEDPKGPWRRLFGGSSDKDTIRFILKHYEFDYTTFGGTYIIVSASALANWEHPLERLPEVAEDLVEACHIVLAPLLDHGFEIVSNKISEKEFIFQSAQVARRCSKALRAT